MCHVGSLTFRNPDVFLEGVRRFLEKNRVESSVHIKFIGLPLESLEETTRRLGLNEIVSMESVKSYEDAQEILA
jgi:hypothetical protein